MARNRNAEIACALDAAAKARRVLSGQEQGEGFWTMPHGAHYVRLCWQQNMGRARRLIRES